jgi:starch phosphorylase
MPIIRKYNVIPSLPANLEPLRELAYNLWWSWNHDAIELFRRLDPELWESSDHNPVKLLGAIRQDKLARAAQDEGTLGHLTRVKTAFDDYLARPTWYSRNCPPWDGFRIGYFSLEYGITECLPIYSGGLGVLAGDHLKSASDLGLPLVGVGLLYRRGYFHQQLNHDGWQTETVAENDFPNLPIRPVTKDGAALTIKVELPGRDVHARVWLAQVGHVPLYLLDANLPENAEGDRALTAQLYSGDSDMRIRQEILLGMGGLRALLALGIAPYLHHLNEGHCAFLALERLRFVKDNLGLNWEEAIEATASGNVFTTHTPVPAGIDKFPPEMIRHYFDHYARAMGVDVERVLALGRANPGDPREHFSMAILALKLSRYANGVSQLHGRVARSMWSHLWPEVPVDEVPVGHVTNGVHARSWVSRDMGGLYDRYLGARWGRDAQDPSAWEGVEAIPDEELWRTHERRRERLVAFVRRSLETQLKRRGLPRHEVEVAREVLDPEALTIGFARRFATYKRATLLFRDPERLKALLLSKDRPVQIIFAGKAHPADNEGKDLIRTIVRSMWDQGLRRRIVFLEDYNINVARYLVQGVDVWLNTPRRPMEASGTSGMKASLNGALNCSILDGWWVEGYAPDASVGWAIGQGEEYDDLAAQDRVESEALYSLLEQEVVPTFYRRGFDGLPREWIGMMKRAIRAHGPVFNTNRMLVSYWQRCYQPAATRLQEFRAERAERGKALAAWKHKVGQAWRAVAVESLDHEQREAIPSGQGLTVSAVARLDGLEPADVTVQLYYGHLSNTGAIEGPQALTMEQAEDLGGGRVRYRGSIPCASSGEHGYTVRILPRHADLVHPFEMHLIRWA